MADTVHTNTASPSDLISYRSNLNKPQLGCVPSVIKDSHKLEEQSIKVFLSRYPTLAKTDEQIREICAQFKCFLSGSGTTRRLHLQFMPSNPLPHGSQWLYQNLNEVEQRARESGTATLDFPDNCFDRVFCIGLEGISRPLTLIADIHRIVKPDGLIWIQTSQPCWQGSEQQEARSTYWCITAVGLCLLLQSFQELASSVQLDPESILQSESFYFGRKHIFDAEVVSQQEPPREQPF